MEGEIVDILRAKRHLGRTKKSLELTLLESMINIQQCQVISIDMCKSHLCLIRLLLHLIWSHKTLRDFKCSKKRQEEKWTRANNVAQM